jgi:hypothetical protein
MHLATAMLELRLRNFTPKKVRNDPFPRVKKHTSATGLNSEQGNASQNMPQKLFKAYSYKPNCSL